LHTAARTLTENAIGGSGDDTLTGDLVSNKLTGNADKDPLANGMPYLVDNVRDVIIEILTDGVDAGGTDTVASTITYSLTPAYELTLPSRRRHRFHWLGLRPPPDRKCWR